MNLQKCKTVCITTDGDPKLMRPGCVVDELRKYFNEANDMINVWCVAHRLVLAFECLEETEYLKEVFMFIKWISKHSIRCYYSTYVHRNESDLYIVSKLPTIGAYCKTRWLFNGNRVNSIFKQLYPIYKFLEDNPFHKAIYKTAQRT